jgi:queuosine precursor transporter
VSTSDPAVSGGAPLVRALPPVVIVVIAVYAAVQLLADIASLKIGVVFGLAVDMGTFIYPLTFTLRDLAHRVLGRRNARVLIVAAALLNLLAVLYLIGSARVPSDAGWGLGAEYAAIFTPIWRIVVFSIIAQLVSQLVNTEIYHWFATRVTRRHHWLRVLVSNTASIPLDNLIFVLGAFAWTMPWSTVGEIFLFNLVVKYVVMCCSIPLIYTTRYDVT